MARSWCATCGGELAERHRGCPRCGAAVPVPAPPEATGAATRARRLGEGSLVVGGAVIIVGVVISRFGPPVTGLTLEGLGLAVILVGAFLGRSKR